MTLELLQVCASMYQNFWIVKYLNIFNTTEFFELWLYSIDHYSLLFLNKDSNINQWSLELHYNNKLSFLKKNKIWISKLAVKSHCETVLDLWPWLYFLGLSSVAAANMNLASG
jgi:hypothetical protein